MSAIQVPSTDAAFSLGRYELRGVLGRGGFATVYRAWDPLLSRDVALKVLLPHLAGDVDLRRRFLAEARTLAGLRHPGLAVVHEAGETAGLPFFAMELIEGGTLARRLVGGRTLSPDEAAAVLAPLAAAVDALHDAGLVHRDIKASNVMLDHSGRVVLMDLGIARALDAESTQSGLLLGTPAAMAPEVLRGEPAGPAADIYALGVLLYQMLAGQPPFTGEVARVLHAHACEPPPDLCRVRPDLPTAACAAVAAALAKDPARRPRRAVELASALAVPTDDGPTRPVAVRPARSRDSARGGAPDHPRAPLRRPPSGRTRRQRTGVPAAGLLGKPGLALGGVMLALLLGALLLRGGGDGTSSLGLPGAATVARRPAVGDLKVLDSVFSGREGAFQVGDSIAACFNLRAGGGSRPLDAVVTAGEPPTAPDGPTVLARSDPIPNKAAATCHAVRLLAPPLAPGDYRLWLLHGGEVLADAPFTAQPRPGDPLLTETFDDPARAVLPAVSPDPARFALGYVDGAYQLTKVDLAFRGMPFVTLPGSYEDATLAVDVRPAGAATDRYVALGCRAASPALDGGYRVSIDLERGTFLLDRWDAGAATSLAEGRAAPFRGGGQANRLELTCAGETIAVAVNGTEVARVRDGGHRAGLFWIGVESDASRRHTVDVRFDNLVVTQR
jgi:serine/threonine-protein kinase